MITCVWSCGYDMFIFYMNWNCVVNLNRLFVMNCVTAWIQLTKIYGSETVKVRLLRFQFMHCTHARTHTQINGKMIIRHESIDGSSRNVDWNWQNASINLTKWSMKINGQNIQKDFSVLGYSGHLNFIALGACLCYQNGVLGKF